MKVPVAIVGGGPGGSAAALFLKKEGVDSVIIERDEFPRYHIGESMTGECGAVVRALGLEDKMLNAKYPTKQGVVVYGPTGNPWYVPVMQRTPENELKEQFTWSVRRSEFDQMLAEEVSKAGIKTLRGSATEPIRDGDAIKGVRVKMNDGGMMDIESELLIDASGQNTFLARAGGVTSKKVPGFYDKQVAIFSQVENPIRGLDNDPKRFGHPDNTLIFYKAHHHWSWFIPLDDKVVSVGVVSPGAYFSGCKESKADFIERELKSLNPDLTRRVTSTKLVEEPRAIPNYSYHVKTFAGKGWLCLGDSHRFIDPIFSFGLYLTMKEAQNAAPHIRDYLSGKNRDAENPLKEHMDWAESGMNVLQDLIDAFWEKPFGFALLLHGDRYRGDMIDMFAGRVHFKGTTPGLEEMRLLKQHGVMKNEEMKAHMEGMAKQMDDAS